MTPVRRNRPSCPPDTFCSLYSRTRIKAVILLSQKHLSTHKQLVTQAFATYPPFDQLRQTNSNMQGNNYGNNKGIGERIKEAIPGTEEHRATHGVTPGHANVEGMKSHLPGTEEHRMREAGVIGGGSAMTGTHGTGTQAHGTMGERIKESIPGTREYEATHGMTGAHRGAEQMKAHIPGTEEHHMRTGVEPGHGMGVMGTGVGTGYGHNTGMGTGAAYDTHHTGTGVGGVGTHHTGLTGTGVGTGGIDPETGKETMGHKIKKMIPGTEENKEKKLAQGRI